MRSHTHMFRRVRTHTHAYSYTYDSSMCALLIVGTQINTAVHSYTYQFIYNHTVAPTDTLTPHL